MVFIDTSLDNWQQLATNAGATLSTDGLELLADSGTRDVVLIDGGSDGMAQIAAWADSHSGYDAVHILSHGLSGELVIGTAQLDSSSLSRYQQQLASLGQSLAGGGSIYLYGCNVAAGDEGESFLSSLAAATGARILASDDDSGAAARGGDSLLEFSTGSTDDNRPDDNLTGNNRGDGSNSGSLEHIFDGYDSLLSVIDMNTVAANSSLSGSSRFYYSSSGWLTVSGDGLATATTSLTALTPGLATGSLSSVISFADPASTTGEAVVRWTADSGSTFDFTSLSISNILQGAFSDATVSGVSWVLTGHKTDGSTLTSSGSLDLEFLSNSGVTDSTVSSYTLSPSGGSWSGLDWIQVAFHNAGDINTGAFLPADYAITSFLVDVSAGSASSTGHAPTAITLDGSSSGTLATGTASALAGASLGTLASVDSDSGDSHSYSLSGSDASLFQISGSTLKVAAAAPLAAGSYSLEITSTDSSGLSCQGRWVVTVADTTAPTLSSLAILPSGTPASGQWKAGDTISLTGTFSEAVEASGSSLELLVGDTVRTASWSSTSGTVVTWNYTVAAGDLDSDGISVTAIKGTIRDTSAAGNLYPLASFAGLDSSSVLVDGVAPRITAIDILPPASGGSSWRQGDTVQVVLTFSETVSVSSAGLLGLVVGGNARSATGSSSGDGTSLVYSYTIQAGDSGDSIAVSGLTAAFIHDTAGNLLSTVLPDSPLVTVTIDAVSPEIVSLAASATASGHDGILVAGDNIELAVTFSEEILLNGGSGAATIDILLNGNSRQFSLVSSDGAIARFRYTVQAGDLAGNPAENGNGASLSLAGTAITLPAGTTVTDSAGNSARLTLPAGSDGGLSLLRIDAVPPEAPLASLPGAVEDDGSRWLAGSNTVRLEGTCEAGCTVTIDWGDGSPADQVSAQSSGTSSQTPAAQTTAAWVSPSHTFAGSGSRTVTFTATDAAGNSTSASRTLVVDSTAPVADSASAWNNGWTGSGSEVVIRLSFSEEIRLDSSSAQMPTLRLTLDGLAVEASWKATGSSWLDFSYTVAGTLSDSGPMTIGELSLNGSSLTDRAGNALDSRQGVLDGATTLASVWTGGHGQPSITSVTADSGTYSTASGHNQLLLTITLDQAVLIDTGGGQPTLTFTAGGVTCEATWQSCTDTTLTFAWAVPDGITAEGIQLGSDALALNGATLRDAATDSSNALLAMPATTLSAVRIDTTAPALTAISSPDYSTLKAGDTLTLTVSWSEAVSSSTPEATSVSFLLGNSLRSASWQSGNGTSLWTYSYTVADGDLSGNSGLSSLHLVNTGQALTDSGGLAASATDQVTASLAVQVDGTAPLASAFALTGATSSLRGVGDSLDVQVTFSEAVSGLGGSTLTVEVDTASGNRALRQAVLLSAGTTSATYRYTVQAGDLDSDGLSVVALNAPLASDSAGNLLASLPAGGILPAGAGAVTLDGSGPAIVSLSLPASGNYGDGETLTFTATFDDSSLSATDANGAAATGLDFMIGSQQRQASLVSLEQGIATWSYTIQPGDDGAGITVTGLSLNGATLQDSAGNAALLALPENEATDALVRVDTMMPMVSALELPQAGLYGAGDTLAFTVTWSEAVLASGPPSSLTLELADGSQVHALLDSAGSGQTSFRYLWTVPAGTLSTGITILSLDSNGGLLRDPASHDAATTLPAVDGSGIILKATAPLVTALTLPASGDYRQGDSLDVTLTFGESISGLDGSTLILEVGQQDGSTARRTATLVSTPESSAPGSPTPGTSATWRYTVQAGDLDSDGIAVVSLVAPAAVDQAGNALDTTLPSGTGTGAVLVDTIAPAITALTLPATGTYGQGESLTFTFTFDETISGLDGSTLVLEIGQQDGTTARRSATLAATSGTSASWSYTVQAGELDSDGIAVIALVAPAAVDRAGNALDLTLPAGDGTGSLVLDGLAPAASSLTLPAAGTYGQGETLTFTLGFDEAVSGLDGSTLILEIGQQDGTTARRSATLAATSGTSASWSYTVHAGDLDSDGIAVVALVAPTATDQAGNALETALPAASGSGAIRLGSSSGASSPDENGGNNDSDSGTDSNNSTGETAAPPAASGSGATEDSSPGNSAAGSGSASAGNDSSPDSSDSAGGESPSGSSSSPAGTATDSPLADSRMSALYQQQLQEQLRGYVPPQNPWRQEATAAWPGLTASLSGTLSGALSGALSAGDGLASPAGELPDSMQTLAATETPRLAGLSLQGRITGEISRQGTTGQAVPLDSSAFSSLLAGDSGGQLRTVLPPLSADTLRQVLQNPELANSEKAAPANSETPANSEKTSPAEQLPAQKAPTAETPGQPIPEQGETAQNSGKNGLPESENGENWPKDPPEDQAQQDFNRGEAPEMPEIPPLTARQAALPAAPLPFRPSFSRQLAALWPENRTSA